MNLTIRCSGPQEGMPTFNAPFLPSSIFGEMDRVKFWALVRFADGDKCWPWEGSINNDGYGRIWFHGKKFSAHRTAYALAIDDIPPGLNVCHSCDNTICCNPSHLWLGTNRQNVNDAKTKGRLWDGSTSVFKKDPGAASRMIRKMRAESPEKFARGERVNTAKLNASDIPVIRNLARSGSFAAIARMYSVTPANIRFIANRKTWKHIA